LYNKEQQSLILEHEICHFERNDMYWNLLAMACLAILWFHPLAWLGYFRFRRDQELSCDQLVLARKQTESRINYSKALLVAAETSPPIAFAQLSFKKYGEKNTMFERIKQIKLNTKASGFALSLVSLLAVTLLSGVSFAGNTDKQKATELKPVMRVAPVYPTQAAEDKVEGSVVIKYDVTAQGDVENVSVVKAEPERIFDQAAKTSVSQWKYESSKYGNKGNMLQLDFALTEGYSKNLMEITERIKVAKK
jgi:TonB family protein